MLQAASDANRFTDGMDREAFKADVVLQRAVGMSLLMAAEAATQIMEKYPEFVAEHPELPWSSIRGMRNRIAHGYFEIDLDKVWDTARFEAPDMVANIYTLRNWRAQGE
ncbi:HepT-like ribonuclease domain-containing protein [Rhizobium sp. BK251]|uniref:HepT-like ribonuclease domain-containing protein n=1 Tax=Rhizobium sp. BK251 TaxID=2512125 RepID=UPI001FE17E91|nr:HepT-like ribonuclease domain-containing protein [Rhizobium sp. BK251]